jgi:hypothetical protein
MASDRQRFHQSELFVRQFRRRMQLLSADQKAFAQTAVDHDADDVECCAAVPLSSATGKAGSAVHIGLNAAAITDFNIRNAIADGQNLNTQFMAGNSRILEERKFPQKTAEICAADSHSVSSHKNLAGAGWTGISDIHVFKAARFFESNGFHERSVFQDGVK